MNEKGEFKTWMRQNHGAVDFAGKGSPTIGAVISFTRPRSLKFHGFTKSCMLFRMSPFPEKWFFCATLPLMSVVKLLWTDMPRIWRKFASWPDRLAEVCSFSTSMLMIVIRATRRLTNWLDRPWWDRVGVDPGTEVARGEGADPGRTIGNIFGRTVFRSPDVLLMRNWLTINDDDCCS